METKTLKEGSSEKTFPVLLPNYFKAIGITTLLIALSVGIAAKQGFFSSPVMQQPGSKILTKHVFILGLFFITCSRNKVEDEETRAARLRAMVFSFTWAILYFIVAPVSDLVFGDPIQELSSTNLVIGMLAFYMLSFNFIGGIRKRSSPAG